MSDRISRRLGPISGTVAAVAATVVLPLVMGTPANAQNRYDRVVGHVYEATNDAAGNAIQVFDRTANGKLKATTTVGTGGLGLGKSLASQYALVRQGNLLLVVNGGDNTVSSLAITSRGLVARDVEPTGGTTPVSVTARPDGTVYVLNQGSENITGLHVDGRGHLSPIANSTRPLSKDATGTATAAAQVSFTPDGQSLVVTHKGDQAIDTFRVKGSLAGPASRNVSAGAVPYGFDFDRRGNVIVSEAGISSVSSYQLRGNHLKTVSAALPDTQKAACWLVTTADGKFAYVMNSASNSISSYSIGHNGELTLVNAVAATTTAGGTDADITPDGSSLYVRLGNGAVAAYHVNADGNLTFISDTTGAAVNGIAGLITD